MSKPRLKVVCLLLSGFSILLLVYILHRRYDCLKLNGLVDVIWCWHTDPRRFTAFLLDHDADLAKYKLPFDNLYFQGTPNTVTGAMALRCAYWQDWPDCERFAHAALLRNREPFALEALIREAKALNRPDLVSGISTADLNKLPSDLYVDYLIAEKRLNDALILIKKVLDSTSVYKTEDERKYKLVLYIKYNRKLAESLCRAEQCDLLDAEMETVFQRVFGSKINIPDTLKQLPQNLESSEIEFFDDLIFMAYFARNCAKNAGNKAIYDRWQSRGSMLAKWAAETKYATEWDKRFVVSMFK